MTKRQALPTAPSASFRQRGLLEQAGEQFSRAALPAGARSWLKNMYYRALMAQTMGRGLPSALPHGEVVRVHPAHRYMTWNPDEYEAFRSVIRPGMIALDIGANVGSYAILLGQWAGAAGKVFAFEPAPAVHAGLVEHIALNQLKDIVHPVAAAVGDTDGHAPFLAASTAGEGRLASSSERSSGSVQMVTIDTFCRAQGINPDFIKIDVEGCGTLGPARGARDHPSKPRQPGTVRRNASVDVAADRRHHADESHRGARRAVAPDRAPPVHRRRMVDRRRVRSAPSLLMRILVVNDGVSDVGGVQSVSRHRHSGARRAWSSVAIAYCSDSGQPRGCRSVPTAAAVSLHATPIDRNPRRHSPVGAGRLLLPQHERPRRRVGAHR